MTKGRRIKLLEDYIILLEKESIKTHPILLNIGYECDDDDYDEGEKLRGLLKWEERLKWREDEASS